MPNLFDTAIAQFINVMSQYANVTVTYKRGVETSTITTGWPGETKKVSDEQSNAKEQWWDRQYFIPVADLVLDGDIITPAVGDRITEGTAVYEIVEHESEPAWDYLDYQKTIWAIRTKEITE